MIRRPVAVVTGASSGIGRELAIRLNDRGLRVLAVARRADRLAELAAGSPLIEPFAADVTEQGAAARILEEAAWLGDVELLVCNAGRGHFAPFHSSDLSTLDSLVTLNVRSTMELVHKALPGMRSRGRGGVIVVSSNLGVVPTPNMAVYAVTKAFLLSWTHALRHENQDRDIRFMALVPGPTVSGFSDASGLGDQVARTPGHTTAEQVAEAALRAWDKGRDSVVPGRFMKFLTGLLDVAPRNLGRRIMGQIFA